MRYSTFLISIVLLCGIFNSANAGEQSRPKVGLVLSGGGARGAAHIGVIEALESLNVPIDSIVGTSFGAVVGGLYAAGIPIGDIDTTLSNVDWELVLRDEVPRDQLYYRRKRDHDIFLIQTTLGFKHGQFYVPKGAVGGQRLYSVFKTMLLPRHVPTEFSQLTIPFTAVATDIVTGRSVILQSGDLALAMLASMSVPGLYAPVEVDDWMLVDGGVVHNLPIEIAEMQDLDVLIVVDVGTLMLKREEIDTFQDVLGQLTNIYVRKNVDKSLTHLDSDDILIQPDLTGVGTASFDVLNKAVPKGREAAIEKMAFLKKLASTASQSTQAEPITIDAIEIHNTTRLATEIYLSYLAGAVGVLQAEQLSDQIDHLLGLSLFESIRYEVVHVNDKHVLSVKPTEKSWGPNYIQGSLFFETDFEGDSEFTLGMGLTRMPLNELAGEARAYGLVGKRTGLLLEYYQPFTSDLAWYWLASTRYLQEGRKSYIQDKALSEYLVSVFDGGLTLGRNISDWGRASVGFKRTGGRYSRMVGMPEVIDKHFADGEILTTLEWDTLNDAYFPRKGVRGGIEHSAHRTRMGSDIGFDQISIRSVLTHSASKHTLVGLARYQTVISHQAPLYNQFALGGLFRLSGLSRDQLIGQEAVLAAGIYYYELTQAKIIPNYPFPVYAGASIETGNTWAHRKGIFEHAYRPSGSIFLGFDSALGPIYFGLGVTKPNRRALHLTIGSPF